MTRFQRTPETVFAVIDSDVVALHVERGHCFGMEQVTAEVWDMLEQPVTIDEICGRLLSRYKVEADRCWREIQQLIEQMTHEGLVRVVADTR